MFLVHMRCLIRDRTFELVIFPSGESHNPVTNWAESPEVLKEFQLWRKHIPRTYTDAESALTPI